MQGVSGQPMTQQELQRMRPAARLKTLAPCTCGSWPHDFMTPCLFLESVATLERWGYCAQCGRKIRKQLGWDETMGMPVKVHWCPNGCSHGMEWGEVDEPAVIPSEEP